MFNFYLNVILLLYISINQILSSHCKAVTRSYMLSKDIKQFYPPLLYSYPGSGNTWCRLLIEYATGIYSGSFFYDFKLYDILPGEKHCNRSQSVIKAHPHAQPFHEISLLNTSNNNNSIVEEHNKCSNNNLNNFTKAILLIRNPYDAMWSEFQRKGSGLSHNHGILKSEHKTIKIKYFYNVLLDKYIEMWNRDYYGFIKLGTTLIVKYEDLKNETIRLNTLSNIIEFIKIPKKYYRYNNNKEKLQTLKCAFELADSPIIHRTNSSTSGNLTDRELYWQKDEVFTKDLVCLLWKDISIYAKPLGYSTYNNYKC